MKRTYTLSDFKANACQHVLKQIEAIEQAEVKKAKKNKFNAKKVEVDGIRFDSKKEYCRWVELGLLQKIGEISDLQRQVKFRLTDGTESTSPIHYVADFQYKDKNGNLVVEDVKSTITQKQQSYRDKKKMMYEKHGITIKET